MFDSVTQGLPTDVLICSAAVADWKFIPKTFSNKKIDINNKIKKDDKNLLFETIQNPDILGTIAKSNLRPKIVIGFSAETNNIKKNAHSKLISKNVDLIIANDVSNNKVFGEDFNTVCLIDKNNCEEWEKQSKKSVAFNLANKINDLLTNFNQ
jgi:phosphopantothenoylcysteine decarboxylase/phosphopantothenate--cysteine ligase